MGSNILQLLAAIIVFVLVLFVTYYVTKWIARSGVIQPNSKNIKVIESFKIAPNKYIQIVKLGSKFYSIGVTKENITFLAELEEEQLDLIKQDETIQNMSFKDVLGKVSSSFIQKNNKDNK